MRSVREKIRTPDLLIRSQTLYPAELRAHISMQHWYFITYSPLCQQISRFHGISNNFEKICKGNLTCQFCGDIKYVKLTLHHKRKE